MTPVIEVRSGFYMCGTRWSLILIDPLAGEYLLHGGIKEEWEAKALKNTLLRMYESGRQGVPFAQLC